MIRDTSAGLQASVGRAGLDIDLGRANGDKGQLLVAQRATAAASAPVLTVVDLGAFEVELLDGDAIVILGAEELGDNQRVRMVD